MRDVYTAAIAGPKTELFDGTPEEVAALVEEARLFGSADRLARALTVLDDAGPRDAQCLRSALGPGDSPHKARSSRVRLDAGSPSRAHRAIGGPDCRRCSEYADGGRAACLDDGDKACREAAPAKGGVAPTRGAMPAAAMGRGQGAAAPAAASRPTPDPVMASAAAPAATPVPPAARYPLRIRNPLLPRRPLRIRRPPRFVPPLLSIVLARPSLLDKSRAWCDCLLGFRSHGTRCDPGAWCKHELV